MRLDTARNELLVTNTVIAILAGCISFGALITAIFGMSIDNLNSLQPIDGLFEIIVGVSFSVIVVSFVVIVTYMKRVKIIPTRIKLKYE
eukprot:gene11061-14847_t